jgi:D,D-heptose 1,7-bisphosphate phosphatase
VSELPHTIDLYNGCLTQLGARAVAKRPVMMLTDEECRVPKEYDPGEGPYIVMAPGAAHPVKQWPLERFVETAQLLSEELNRKIVWALTEADAVAIGGETAIADQLKLINCPIPYLGAIVQRADALVANDSGVAHLGSAVGTPVVALFGPTHPSLGFSPRGMNDRIVQVDERCRPCSRHGKRSCHRDQRYCFTQIAPSTVAEAVQAAAESAGDSRAIFVDRDGTIIKDKHYLADPDGVEFEEGAIEALRLIGEMGYKIVILSNQSGVARGKLDIAQVEQVNDRLLEMLAGEGVEVDGLYYCPHHRDGVRRHYAIACDCRKPAAGMAEEAARQLDIDLRRSVVVGDKIDDFNLGRVIGARSFLVKTGHGAEQSRMIGGSEKKMVRENLLDIIKEIELSGQQ